MHKTKKRNPLEPLDVKYNSYKQSPSQLRDLTQISIRRERRKADVRYRGLSEVATGVPYATGVEVASRGMSTAKSVPGATPGGAGTLNACPRWPVTSRSSPARAPAGICTCTRRGGVGTGAGVATQVATGVATAMGAAAATGAQTPRAAAPPPPAPPAAASLRAGGARRKALRWGRIHALPPRCASSQAARSQLSRSRRRASLSTCPSSVASRSLPGKRRVIGALRSLSLSLSRSE
mmetsp:Transcript_28297/g.63200  ORF Transcript_28297/g.63200 Transcript_28297/m.63200 type:complete len:236 (+) Transcript_28297:101-808(+)